jgi:hypothetical protein
MIVKTPFFPHPRVKKVFLKAFASYDDEEVLELLFQHAEERGGRTFPTSCERRWI